MVIIKYVSGNAIPTNFTGIVYDNNKYFLKNDIYHRYCGPAIIWLDDDKEWRFNNKYYGSTHKGYSQKQFKKDLNKLFLS